MDTSGSSTPGPQEPERADGQQPPSSSSSISGSGTPAPEADASAGSTQANANGASPAHAPLAEDRWLVPPVAAAAANVRARAASRGIRARRHRRYIFYLRRTARTRHATRSRTFARVAWASVIVALLMVLSVVTATAGAAASYYQSQQTEIASLSHTVASKDSVRIYDDKGTLLYEFTDYGAQHSISLANIPITVVNATVAIEDHTFWVNQGVDFTSIARAALADYKSQATAQGGSTITQQLIKQNILGSNENFDRKIREAILALGITTQGVYTKRQILEMYLNSIPYGGVDDAYGIDEAAHAYFGYTDDPVTGETAAQHLDLAQASMLAGIPQNPNLNNPLAHPQHAHDRQRQVLDAMVQYGYITRAQENAALAESARPDFFHPSSDNPDLAPHFVDFIKGQLDSMINAGQLHLSRSGLNVYTTLDLDMQNNSQNAINEHLHGIDRTDYASGPPLIRENNVTNAAALMVDQHNGDIKVMIGSANYYDPSINGQNNVVTNGYRGPGSSFKPFIYATAFEKGWFPAMTISDMPTVFWDNGAGRDYKPLDFNYNEFWGTVTLRTALQNSLNIPAVRTMQFAGVDNVKQTVQRMGITKWNGTWGLSSALGSLEVTPYEMVQAYTVFANYGQFIPLHAINRITDSSGDVLYQYHVPQPIQVMSPQIAYLVTSMLTDNKARAKDFGPCTPLYLDPDIDSNPAPGKFVYPKDTPGCGAIYAGHGYSPAAWPDAAKTGTGEDFKDDWTMGYTMDYTGGVWVGNSNDTPMSNIDGITGAAPIWYHTMLYAEESQHLPKRQFPVPQGVHQATYTSNGMTTTDWFLDGPMPPPNLGNVVPQSLPCIRFNNNPDNPWDYSSGGCQGSLIPNGPNVNL